MRVKKFVARTLPEAMGQVKAELGADAVILQTSEIKVGGVFGLFGSRMIQVMAAVEEKQVLQKPAAEQVLSAAGGVSPLPGAAGRPMRLQAPPPLADLPPALQQAAGRAAVSDRIPMSADRIAPASAPDTADVVAVREEMAGMKAMMGQIISRLDQPAAGARLEPALREVLTALTHGGVQEDVAMSLIGRVRARITKGQGGWNDALDLTRTLMVKDLGGAEPLSGTGCVVALVGPTGVGKTTTLAKLAAHLALNQRQRVALITADTYRIAAVEQLRTYSEIIGVSLDVVYEPSEVGPLLAARSDADLILVDTAGRSPRNSAHMNELKSYLDVLEPAETYLVLSLTSGYRDAVMIVDHYLPMGFDHFLFTKWDEAASPGLIYNLVAKYKRPLSYVTNGQNVPDDIEVADPETITRAILGV